MTNLQNDDELLVFLRRTFIGEAATFLTESEAALMDLENTDNREGLLAEIFRSYHSVKGSAASVGYQDLADFGHVAEDCLSALRNRPDLLTSDMISLLLRVNDALRARVESLVDLGDCQDVWDTVCLEQEIKATTALLTDPDGAVQAQAVDKAAHGTPVNGFGFFDDEQAAPKEKVERKVIGEPSPAQGERKSQATNLAFKIEAAKVDAVMDMVGELVVLKSQLVDTLPPNLLADVRTRAVIGQLDKSVRELHEKTLAMRMLSLKGCFLKVQRIARDLSQKLGKPVNFTMSGEDTELDRVLIEQISDPLVHLCRNAIDHGIETPEQRREAGKPEQGSILIKAFRRGEGVVIEIIDDGRGIDKAKILQKAIANGLIAEDTQITDLSEAKIYDFIFNPGFSTASAVTDVSGRGVGLDVVKSNIAGVKGRVEISSEFGVGSCFRLTIPLTTAITDGIIVELVEEKYVIPIEYVRTFVEARQANVVRITSGDYVIGVADKHYPLISVPKVDCGVPEKLPIFAILDLGERMVALGVTSVIGKTQVVLKGLRSELADGGLFSGAAVMGDGRVALVLDVLGISSATHAERPAV